MPSEVVRRRLLLWGVIIAAAFALSAIIAVRTETGYAVAGYIWTKLRGGSTVAERVEEFGPRVAARLQPAFASAGVVYPPHEVAYVSIKDRRVLQLYARAGDGAPWSFIREYPVLAQSGALGPKLRAGDRQVPEGMYAAEYLNANSRFHLSIRLNYPNEFDQAAARSEGRANLGSDIMIHGAAASIGCLAVGNAGAEDLFVLAALVTKDRVRILVSPVDFRRPGVSPPAFDKPWIDQLYRKLATELAQFPPAT